MVQMLTTQTNKETRCKCSRHNQIHFICSPFLFWLCFEHLQRVRCQIDESVFLMCRCFFFICSVFLFWLCCEHLQRVRCQIDESVFLICRCFFFYLQPVSFFGCVVSICSVCDVKLTKVFSSEIRSESCCVGGTPRTNVHLICRLSHETKLYPIRKRADKDVSIINTVMTQHKRIWTLSLREGGI